MKKSQQHKKKPLKQESFNSNLIDESQLMQILQLSKDQEEIPKISLSMGSQKKSHVIPSIKNN